MHASPDQPGNPRPRGYESLAEEMRNRVTGGDYQPGERLPSREELAAEFDTSKLTMQRAMQLLIDNGFVVTRGRSGSFVSETPPHLCRYALAYLTYPGYQDDFSYHRANWSMLDDVTRYVAQQISIPNKRQLDCFFGLLPEVSDEHSNRQALIEAARSQTLTGIIFPHYPGAMSDVLSWVNDLGIPIVSFPSPIIPGFCAGIDVAHDEFVELCVNTLVARGCRRIARLSFGQLPVLSDDPTNTMAHVCREVGIPYLPEWMLQTDMHQPHITYQIIRLLMSSLPHERPDGLIIDDEHLAAPVVEILDELSIQIGVDLQVVAHASFPILQPIHPELIRVGFDVYEMYERAHRLVAQMKKKEMGTGAQQLAPITQQGFEAREAERRQRTTDQWKRDIIGN